MRPGDRVQLTRDVRPIGSELGPALRDGERGTVVAPSDPDKDGGEWRNAWEVEFDNGGFADIGPEECEPA